MENECGVEEIQLISVSSIIDDLDNSDNNSDYSEISDAETDKIDLDNAGLDNAELNNIEPELITSDISIDNVELNVDAIEPTIIEEDLDQDDSNVVASDTPSPEMADNSELEMRCKELELKVLMFEEMFSDLKKEINTGVTENGSLIASLSDELSTRADGVELKRLKNDFEHFSKRLKRVAKSEDSISAEVLDATKVPPDVLEITYAKTLNDLYSAITDIFGSDESSDIVENIRDQVRQFSAGVDFFIFEDGIFRIQGLSTAINSKLVSVKQIHGTYVELFKLLHQYVPNYDSQDFRSFVETGSREYAVEKIVAHEKIIEKLISDQNTAIEDLSNLTENMQFMAELQNNQLEDQKITKESVIEISEQIKSVTKAINLHTKALKKLNEKFISIGSSGYQADNAHVPEMSIDISGLEDSVQSKADRDELMAVSNALNVFREEVNSTLGSIDQGIQESVSQADMIRSIQSELDQLREEMANKAREPIPITDVVNEPIIPSLDDLELLIVQKLTDLESATLKQLEQQVNSNGNVLTLDDLNLLIDHMTEKNIVTSFKKGRYIYFSLVN